MAQDISLFSLKITWIQFLLLLPFIESMTGCFTSIISFGDSLSDTGNFLRISEPDNLPIFAFPPYGESYFHQPTGRCSDGRLIIDFIAQHLGLPLVPPYFGANLQNLTEGVNFAVVGAAALDSSFFEEHGIFPFTNSSLKVQLAFFKQLLQSLCSTSPACNEFLHNSLIIVGGIGGNDYYHSLIQGISTEDLWGFVPFVVNSISLAIQELIEVGAMTIMVPGNMPSGCSPAYLTYFDRSSEEEYEPSTGCLIWLNRFTEYHNELLQMELNRIQRLHPNAKIVYADYYNAAMQLRHSPLEFGFTQVLKACCGGGGRYNYNLSAMCGTAAATSCDDPSLYIGWDGLHFTEAAYRFISEAMFEGPYSIPGFFNTSCIREMVNE